ncbi:hypothetical protein BDQ12DRAFT_111347 [Crucibulum laeve]|uniref:Uncharacterized protein n=1 Tax=Crucibulum laeve TaxID=68775 RepID=A0A5C3MB70_9AGAR|nr:hypothetical protein BDQ12DRAFT_111347 [Crucibulum laeve]
MLLTRPLSLKQIKSTLYGFNENGRMIAAYGPYLVLPSLQVKCSAFRGRVQEELELHTLGVHLVLNIERAFSGHRADGPHCNICILHTFTRNRFLGLPPCFRPHECIVISGCEHSVGIINAATCADECGSKRPPPLRPPAIAGSFNGHHVRNLALPIFMIRP